MRQKEDSRHQLRAEFQEAPGETEADAIRDAFLRSAGPGPNRLGPALANADGATRNHAVSRLQEERGNAYVQRVVAESRGTPGRLVGLSQPERVDEGLLAHEIAHVGQQTGFGGQAVQRQVEGGEEEKKGEQAQTMAPPKKEEEEATA